MSTHKAIDQLPSLPQILVKILDAIQGEAADFQQLADIIRQDPTVTTKLIQVASSSYFGRSQNCSSVERALMYLGTDTVKTIVITTAIKQFFNHFSQVHQQFMKRFWRRSLTTASFAQAIAALTRFPLPDEAYLCGLISDVGQLILLTEFDEQYLQLINSATTDHSLIEQEQNQLHFNHCEVAADLVDSWGISEFMGDAIRYHHEDLDQIQDAQHFVKIIYLASLLSSSDEITDSSLKASHDLFGLNEALTREIHGRILSDVKHMAASLNIDLSDDLKAQNLAHQTLGKRLGELGEISQINQALWQTQNKENLELAIGRSLLLTFGIQQCLLFDYDEKQNLLINQSPTLPSPLNISAQAGRSLLSDALLSLSVEHSLNHPDRRISVIDRQIIRLCSSEHILCLPLITDNKAIAVLALGLSEKQLLSLNPRFGQLLSLGHEIANNIAKLSTKSDSGDNNSQEELNQHIREAVHEASNPLSIIRNYLEMLRINLGESHSANENLDLIKDEIDRVGQILLRLKDPKEVTNDDSLTDINQVIENISHIFINSTCAAQKISLKLVLDKEIQPAKTNKAYLKQILTNLIKNACEALSAGNEILVRSEANVNSNGRHFTAIIISDNGPGIPKAIKEQLFSPQQSSKGGKHSGLGLSIVRKLVDEMGGSITCHSHQKTTNSESSGTEFHLLLPQ